MMAGSASRDTQRTPHPLDFVFHPRSVAVVGASTDPNRWRINEFYIEPLLKMGYQGKVYPVNPRANGSEILGLPAYRSLKEVPGPVDHVVSCIPASGTLQLLDECREVHARVLQLYTAGFAETGEAEDIELQGKLLDKARQSNIRILGPNCMGVYCPSSKIGFCPTYPRKEGPIGLISQSGSNASYIIRSAVARGLYFSKAVSHGNACDINECDLLDYLADDPDTKVIAAYIEGTSEPERFRRIIARAASLKPVVIYKGGYTEGGRRAASSHTGALAGSDAVWDGLLKQAGALRVYSVDEMTDMLVAILRMKPPRGWSTCIVGNGGGPSLLATDEFERGAFRLPPIPADIRHRARGLISLAGSMLRNPMDVVPLFGSQQERLINMRGFEGWEQALPEMAFHRGDNGWGDFFGILNDWPGLDFAVLHYSMDSNPGKLQDWVIGTAVGPMLGAAGTSSLSLAMVMHFIANEESWLPSLKTQQLVMEAGLPLFFSMRGAARAIHRLILFNRAHPELLAPLREEAASR